MSGALAFAALALALGATWRRRPAPNIYATDVQARIARLEHLLMIAGHEAECPACNGEAWPLRPPKTVKGLR